MTTSSDRPLKARRVWFTRSAGRGWLMVELADGRAVGLPLAACPTLKRASAAQRSRYRLIGRGYGVHWPGLDLDLSIDGIVAGRGEVPLEARRKSA
jgi:hypothetical protein